MLCLGVGLLATAAHSLSHVTTDGTSIGLGTLTAYWQSLLMAASTITTDFLETLDILFHDVTELSFDTVFLFDHVAETVGVFSDDILGPGIRIDTEFFENLLAGRQTDTIHVGQSDFDSFVVWNVDSRDTYHRVFTEKPGLALALLMFRIGADNEQDAFALDDLALDTDFFDRGSYFHIWTATYCDGRFSPSTDRRDSFRASHGLQAGDGCNGLACDPKYGRGLHGHYRDGHGKWCLAMFPKLPPLHESVLYCWPYIV